MCFLMLHLKLIPLKLKYNATSSSIHYMHSLFLLLQFYVYLFIYYNIHLLVIKLIIIILAPSLFHSFIHHSVFSLDIFLFNSLLILFLKTNNSISLSSLVIKLAFLYLFTQYKIFLFTITLAITILKQDFFIPFSF